MITFTWPSHILHEKRKFLGGVELLPITTYYAFILWNTAFKETVPSGGIFQDREKVPGQLIKLFLGLAEEPKSDLAKSKGRTWYMYMYIN